jgi:hypothetical protein
VVGCLVALAAGPAYATDQALLDALVRKGILTDKEAQQIEQEVSKEAVAPAPAIESKIKLGDWVQELKLYGDIRLRGQYDAEQPQIPPAPRQTDYPNVSQRWRWRFRLRLNADVKLTGGLFAGFGLQTNNAADSANQTFTQGFDNYGIYVNKAFIGYSPVDGITVVGGKQANPFYTTDLFWDPDIFPQGLVERIDLHKLFDMSFGESGYSKEGKAPLAPPPEASRNALELSLIAGQFIFYDNNEYNAVTKATGNIKNDAYEFETQLLARLKLGKDFAFTVAPAVFITNDAEVGSAGNPAIALNNQNAFNGNQRDELILLAPGDISFKIAKLPVKLYWDFAYNFHGNDRWNNEYGPLFNDVTFNAARTAITGFPASSRVSPSFSDNLAWLIGIQLGQNKKQGDWSIFGNFRQVGLTSIDPNINDSDWALSNLNMQGFKLGLAYNVTDYAVFAVTGYITWNLTQSLYGGAANSFSNLMGFGIARDNTVDTVQVDLNVQF